MFCSRKENFFLQLVAVLFFKFLLSFVDVYYRTKNKFIRKTAKTPNFSFYFCIFFLSFINVKVSLKMRAVVSFSECLSDSPKFRSALQQNETNLDELELRLEKMIKLCSAMTEGGRMYVTQQVIHAFDHFFVSHCCMNKKLILFSVQ